MTRSEKWLHAAFFTIGVLVMAGIVYCTFFIREVICYTNYGSGCYRYDASVWSWHPILSYVPIAAGIFAAQAIRHPALWLSARVLAVAALLVAAVYFGGRGLEVRDKISSAMSFAGVIWPLVIGAFPFFFVLLLFSKSDAAETAKIKARPAA